MESSRNATKPLKAFPIIIKGGQNGVKSQHNVSYVNRDGDYKGGAKWSQVATWLAGE